MNAIPALHPATTPSLSFTVPGNQSVVSTPPNTNLFQHLVATTNSDQLAGDQAIQDFIQQKPHSNIQQVVLAVAQAEMSFQFFMELRNSLIDSYNELMRMQF